ncbi:DNA damage-binding protein 1a [Geranomyces variabilis]|nr:DNA damage-binding protein 1a [Geranomyces variabilis]
MSEHGKTSPVWEKFFLAFLPHLALFQLDKMMNFAESSGDANLYVVSARKPDSVSHVLSAAFTAHNHTNVIVCKVTHIEIFLLEPVEGSSERQMRLLLDVPIYGRVTTIGKCRFPDRSQDVLVLTTEAHNLLVIRYNTALRRLETEISDSVSEFMGAASDGHVGLVAPDGSFAAYHNYQGIVHVLELGKHHETAAGGSVLGGGGGMRPKSAKKSRLDLLRRPLDPIKFWIDERWIIGMTLMESPPTEEEKTLMLAVLYQDKTGQKNLKLYRFNFKTTTLDLYTGVGARNLKFNPSLIIPIPREGGGGIIVISEEEIKVFTPTETYQHPIAPTIIRCWAPLDPKGTRYLLCDFEGRLYALILGGRLQRVRLENLGQVSQPSAIAYLGDGHVYLGSHFGDSQLLRLKSNADAEGNMFELRMEFENLAPIVDFCVIDIDKQGQDQVVAACGGNKDGSLRVIRNGIGIEVLGTLDDVPNLTGIWALRRGFDEQLDDLLVMSFNMETKMIGKDEDGALAPVDDDDASAGGFILDQPTLACANVKFDQIVQVVPSGIVTLDSRTRALVHFWKPTASGGVDSVGDDATAARVHHATINREQVVIALGGGRVVYLEVVQGELLQKSEVQLENEVSCVTIRPLQSSYCLVGVWGDVSVRLLELPSLRELDRQPIESGMIPRSVLLVTIGDVEFAMAALGDGHLYTYILDGAKRCLSGRKSLSLGSRAVSLAAFESQGTGVCVFAASDRPTVIHFSNGKLLYSPVNLKEVTHMCPFHYEEDALALVTGGSLKIGLVEAIQKLHVKKIPIGETIRRIVHVASAEVFVLLTLRTIVDEVAREEEEKGFIRLLDERSYEVLAEYGLESFENPQAIQLARLRVDGRASGSDSHDGRELLCVGTAYVFPEEKDPVTGRLLFFEFTEDRKLRLFAATEVKGCVYCLATVGGRLLAGINTRVEMFGLAATPDTGRATVSPLDSHHGSITVCSLATRGDFVLVGDLIKSVKLLVYEPPTDSLGLVAKDTHATWITGLEAVNDELFVAGEQGGNLIAYEKVEGEGGFRGRLAQCGWFHVGEGVNRIRHGSLTANIVDRERPLGTPVLIFCTVTGGLGVVAQLEDATYKLLSAVQDNMRNVILGVGELSHSQWRSTQLVRGVDRPARGFLDGDLIEQFLDLSPEHKLAVVNGVNPNPPHLVARQQHQRRRDGRPGVPPVSMRPLVGVTVEELIGVVEEMARLH